MIRLSQKAHAFVPGALGGLCLAAGLALVPPATRAADPADKPTESAKGDFVGVWKGVGTAPPKAVRVIEFLKDGTCEECLDPNLKAGIKSVRGYEVKGSQLRIVSRVPGSPGRAPLVIPEEQGKVEWVNGDLFKYTPLDASGRPAEGKQVEFYRQSRPDKAEDLRNVLGTWTRSEKAAPGARAGAAMKVVLDKDGTFDRDDMRKPADPKYGETRFTFKNGILAFTYHYPHPGSKIFWERGKVEWIDKDSFTYTTLDGLITKSNGTGKEYVFKREGRAENPAGKAEEVAAPVAGGKKGDVPGVWEVKEPGAGKRVNVVEFTKDGGYCEGGNLPEPGKGFRYRLGGDTLSITFNAGVVVKNVTDQNGIMEYKKGAVNWINGDLFSFTDASGKKLEFHRQSGPENKNRGAKLIGTWVCKDPKSGRELRRLVFGKDGTYRDGGAGTGDGHYIVYKDRILCIIWEDARGTKFLQERGRVDWAEDERSFRLTVLDGAQAHNNGRAGTVYEFVREP